MQATYQGFLVALYEEHLEEASFLYEQRRHLLLDAEMPWQRLGDFEERLEAHIDALVVGQALALEVCLSRVVEGDAGELYAAVSVICRCRDARSLANVWRSLDFADPAKTQALRDALSDELPDGWRAACARALTSGDERLVPILAAACAHRRVEIAEEIAKRILSQSEQVKPATVWALSRLPVSVDTMRALDECHNHADPAVKSNALLGLLHAGNRNAVRSHRSAAQTESWPHIAIGLAGDRAATPSLIQCLKSGAATSDTVVALGLLGDVSGVRALCATLDSPELGASAALALHWITGAALYADEFVAETVDESELFELELIAWRERGEVPHRADGKPFGATVRQLSRDPAKWDEWLAQNAPRFDPEIRYRRGQGYGPGPLLQCLLDPIAPAILRQLAYEELGIHFGCRVRFESDMRVVEQMTQLREIAQWTKDNEPRFETSRWLGNG